MQPTKPQTMPRPPLIRPAREADAEAIAALYAHHVLNGLGTFEEVPPDPGEMRRRHAAIAEAGMPWLVAEDEDGGIQGYAYAGPFRTRSAYRHTLEDSVYVAPGLAGRGIGRLLLGAVIDEAEKGPWRQMIAVIGNSANEASIRLHAGLGFRVCGTLEAVGLKHGQWVDCVLMQRALGPGSTALP